MTVHDSPHTTRQILVLVIRVDVRPVEHPPSVGRCLHRLIPCHSIGVVERCPHAVDLLRELHSCSRCQVGRQANRCQFCGCVGPRVVRVEVGNVSASAELVDVVLAARHQRGHVLLLHHRQRMVRPRHRVLPVVECMEHCVHRDHQPGAARELHPVHLGWATTEHRVTKLCHGHGKPCRVELAVWDVVEEPVGKRSVEPAVAAALGRLVKLVGCQHKMVDIVGHPVQPRQPVLNARVDRKLEYILCSEHTRMQAVDGVVLWRCTGAHHHQLTAQHRQHVHGSVERAVVCTFEVKYQHPRPVVELNQRKVDARRHRFARVAGDKRA
eukprot:m.156959 g.156959  ORF g.156959 m.156959 type:complete len:325 (-) comp11726_c1_seq15:168-1142(-)